MAYSKLDYEFSSYGNTNETDGFAGATAPPPTYESVINSDVRLWSTDFWPESMNGDVKIKHAQFGDFQSLISKANEFLLQQPNIILKNAQTIIKKCVKLVDVYNGCMTFKQGTTHACYIIGLRLWFCMDCDRHRTTPVQISYMNLVPKRLNPGVKYAEYEPFDVLVRNFNEKQHIQPLEGKVISVDTVCLKIEKNYWKRVDGCISVDDLMWIDEIQQIMFNFLRLFYIVGPPAYEYIGFQDFIPGKIKGCGMLSSSPQFCQFSTILPAVQQWMQGFDNTSKIIQNIQTLETLYVRKSKSNTGDDGTVVNIFTMRPFFYKIYLCPRVLFLRLAFIQPHSLNVASLPPQPTIYCRTFLPGYLGKDVKPLRYQSNMQLMKYVLSWLNATRANVICAEFCGPYRKNYVAKKAGMSEQTVNTGEWYEESSDSSTSYYQHKLIYFIRVYLDRYYPEPPPETLEEIPFLEYKDDCVII